MAWFSAAPRSCLAVVARMDGSGGAGCGPFLAGRGGEGEGCCSPAPLVCPLRPVLFFPAVDFFSSASSGSLVVLEFLVAAEGAVVGFFPGALPGGLRRRAFPLPVRALWV
jgi:hypothetical protein